MVHNEELPHNPWDNDIMRTNEERYGARRETQIIKLHDEYRNGRLIAIYELPCPATKDEILAVFDESYNFNMNNNFVRGERLTEFSLCEDAIEKSKQVCAIAFKNRDLLEQLEIAKNRFWEENPNRRIERLTEIAGLERLIMEQEDI